MIPMWCSPHLVCIANKWMILAKTRSERRHNSKAAITRIVQMLLQLPQEYYYP